MHIRVVTPVIPTGLTQASDFEGILRTDAVLDYIEIAAGPASIECALDEVIAAPAVVAAVVEAEAEGVDAVLIDCMEDPGLVAARECVSIPVLGPCETAMNLACILGHRFSMLAVTENMRMAFENRARIYGAWDKYASTRSVEVPVLELRGDSDHLAERLLDASRLAIEKDGADTLVIGCTGMVGLAERLTTELLEAGFDVPVIDPIPVPARMAELLTTSGLRHSKRAYPTPKRKPMRGFENTALHKFSGP